MPIHVLVPHIQDGITKMNLQPKNPNPAMKTSDLIFVGIKGSVVALNRATGQQVWVARLKGGDFVKWSLRRDKQAIEALRLSRHTVG
jgi:hypothetical protein